VTRGRGEKVSYINGKRGRWQGESEISKNVVGGSLPVESQQHKKKEGKEKESTVMGGKSRPLSDTAKRNADRR